LTLSYCQKHFVLCAVYSNEMHVQWNVSNIYIYIYMGLVYTFNWNVFKLTIDSADCAVLKLFMIHYESTEKRPSLYVEGLSAASSSNSVGFYWQLTAGSRSRFVYDYGNGNKVHVKLWFLLFKWSTSSLQSAFGCMLDSWIKSLAGRRNVIIVFFTLITHSPSYLDVLCGRATYCWIILLLSYLGCM